MRHRGTAVRRTNQYPDGERTLGIASRGAAVWAFGYGLYRSYYALGGTFAMLGTPVSWEQFRRINAIAALLLFVFAIIPLVSVRAWTRRRARPGLLAVAWVITVACTSHALIGIVQRSTSLMGRLEIHYPFWETVDRRAADLQALFFNEPWFLIEGVLWAVIAWTGALRSSPRRGWWLGSAVAAVVGSVIAGVLSAFGIIGTLIIG